LASDPLLSICQYSAFAEAALTVPVHLTWDHFVAAVMARERSERQAEN